MYRVSIIVFIINNKCTISIAAVYNTTVSPYAICTQTRNLARGNVELPGVDMKMSKTLRSIDYINRHCCDIHLCYINCAFVDYNKNSRTTCFDLAQVILRFIIDVKT